MLANRFVRWMCVCTVGFSVSGCDNSGTSNKQGGASANKAAAEPIFKLGQEARLVPIPAAIEKEVSLVEGLSAGKSATLKLDKCPTDPAFKSKDALGSLMCSQEYRVFWSTTTGQWTVVGPNEALPIATGHDLTAASYSGLPPRLGQIMVWGVAMKLQPDSALSLEDGQVVGTLEHTQSQPAAIDVSPPKTTGTETKAK